MKRWVHRARWVERVIPWDGSKRSKALTQLVAGAGQAEVITLSLR